jgi:hypothetical protein
MTCLFVITRLPLLSRLKKLPCLIVLSVLIVVLSVLIVVLFPFLVTCYPVVEWDRGFDESDFPVGYLELLRE